MTDCGIKETIQSVIEEVKHHIADVNAPVDTLPADYQSRAAHQKSEYLWRRINEAPYTNATLPTEGPSKLSQLPLFDAIYPLKAFTHTSDTMAKDRLKLVHPFGTAAKIDLEIHPHSHFTGLFQTGGSGFIRFSLADFNYDNVIPGAAIKILIDGQPSQNFHLIWSLDGQGTDRNMFLHPLSNVIPESSSLTLKALDVSFKGAIGLLPASPNDQDKPEQTNILGLYEQASVTPTGELITPGQAVAPWKIVLQPNEELRESQNCHAAEDFRTALASIPAGTVLYNVVAHATPEDATGESIGRIVTRSGFVASRFVDEGLYFQHARKRWQPAAPLIVN